MTLLQAASSAGLLRVVVEGVDVFAEVGSLTQVQLEMQETPSFCASVGADEAAHPWIHVPCRRHSML